MEKQMAGRIINTWRDPYDLGFSTCWPKQITIQPGLTVLVGCNGSGKTTLINNIKSELSNNNIPYYLYNNLSDGGSHFLNEAMWNNDFSLAATSFCSSEGENITININHRFSKLKEFMIEGRIQNKSTRLADIFRNSPYEIPKTKERWVLLDAVDSGYSIDNVIDIKHIFAELIQSFADNGYELFIVVAANEFELACNTPCMDVTNGKYISFETYDQFRKFIIESRKKKDKRYEKLLKKKNEEDR